MQEGIDWTLTAVCTAIVAFVLVVIGTAPAPITSGPPAAGMTLQTIR